MSLWRPRAHTFVAVVFVAFYILIAKIANNSLLASLNERTQNRRQLMEPSSVMITRLVTFEVSYRALVLGCTDPRDRAAGGRCASCDNLRGQSSQGKRMLCRG